MGQLSVTDKGDVFVEIIRADSRGKTDLGWLDSRHTFSFADYYDPKHMGFSCLRVLNDDRVKPGAGFPTHSHKDMEVITYVLSGAIAHKDSTGGDAVLGAGGVQYMSAGTGISHSEFNASDTKPVHFLQIWIEPRAMGLDPHYGQREFDPAARSGKWLLIVSPDGWDNSAPIHQSACLYAAHLHGESVTHTPDAGRSVYLHVATGSAVVNGESLSAGDGAAFSEAVEVQVSTEGEAELVLFDLP